MLVSAEVALAHQQAAHLMLVALVVVQQVTLLVAVVLLTIQVKVTKTGATITNVTYVQATYTRVPNGTMSYLVSASIQANGSNFTKVSRATVTTNAYKQALESALGKF